MRAIAGPAMLLVIVGGIGLHRLFGQPDEPSRAFLDLELIGADTERTGSCYSLGTVLIANLAFTPSVREWTRAGEDAWTLTLEDLHQTSRGPAHVFQRFTFEKHDDRVALTAVEATEGINTDVRANVDALLDSPNERGSTPVDRCLGSGASGYLFQPKSRR